VKLSGSQTLSAPPEKVWDAITDTEVLARCLPGTERLEPAGPDRYKAVVGFALAAISGKYNGTLEFADKKQPTSLTLKIEGKGTPGFMKGEGRLKLAPVDGGKKTELRYEGDAQVGGMIAAVGQRMIDVAARKIVSQFFEKFSSELGRH
jgi:uncharacterized protein